MWLGEGKQPSGEDKKTLNPCLFLREGALLEWESVSYILSFGEGQGKGVFLLEWDQRISQTQCQGTCLRLRFNQTFAVTPQHGSVFPCTARLTSFRNKSQWNSLGAFLKFLHSQAKNVRRYSLRYRVHRSPKFQDPKDHAQSKQPSP